MSSGHLAKRVMLVCNAATSMGYAIARRLGASGAHVYISDVDETGLRYALDGLRGADISASAITADLADEVQRRALFDSIRKEHAQLNATVICHKPNRIKGDIINSSTDEFDQIFTKYLSVPFFTCREALPLLLESKNGATQLSTSTSASSSSSENSPQHSAFPVSASSSIVFVGSIAGYTPFVDVGLYSAAQTGLLGLCKAMARSLAPRNVRVNAVCLGMFDDDGSGASWSSCSGSGDGAPNANSMTSAEADAVRGQLAACIPLGRTGRGKDVAGLVEFLVSDAASYITGENFPVTGGVAVKL